MLHDQALQPLLFVADSSSKLLELNTLDRLRRDRRTVVETIQQQCAAVLAMARHGAVYSMQRRRS